MKLIDVLKGVNASRWPVDVRSWRMLVSRYKTRHRWSLGYLVPTVGGFSLRLNLRAAGLRGVPMQPAEMKGLVP